MSITKDVTEEETKWHALGKDEVLHKLNSGKDGLNQIAAKELLVKYGLNELTKEEKKHPIWLFIDQFKSFLTIILLIATALSFLVGEILDAVVILAIVIACATLGFVEEYRSEKAAEMLKKMAAPTATVIREGKEAILVSSEIVPGDIVALHVGDRVAADMRLIESINLQTDEAPLTGESVPVEKIVTPLKPETIVGDRRNMGFSGTIVTYGRGLGVVTTTGMKTEFGKIAKMIQTTEEETTPLEKRMDSVGKWLGIFSLVVCGAVAVLNLFRGLPLLETVLWGISLAIAAIPEALPAVVTGALAIGMHEMAKHNAIVRKLPAVETLGCTSVICSDKTGTMTRGEMTVREIYFNNDIISVSGAGYAPVGEFTHANKADETSVSSKAFEDVKFMLRVGALCNDAKLSKDKDRHIVLGDPTEGAMCVVAAKAGISEEELKKYPRVCEIPFTSERKRMTTVHKEPKDKISAYMKGAPELVLERCKSILRNGKEQKLTDADKKKILKANEEMASRALRCLGVAYKPLKEAPKELHEDKVETDFVFLGIEGMIDPPREEVKDAIKMCNKSGIKVVMITGDHRLTATAVAKELGLITNDGEKAAMVGTDLDKLSDEEFANIVEYVRVYARVSPEHKVRIVKALRAKGYIAAMTGDGINDAPALKNADIGISMGISGTEVTKEASAMILQDDNFATIVSAIKEGRRIYDNIKKYLAYLLRCNVAEIGIMLVASIMGLPIPLTAIQLLWVNLTTDGLPALALGVDPAEPDVMERKPRSQTEPIFTKGTMILYFGIIPVILTALLVGTFWYLLGTETLTLARTQTFMAMVFCELFMALSSHSLNRPFFSAKPFNNRFLWIAVIVSFAMQFAVLYIPQLHGPFDITYPEAFDYITAFGSAIFMFAILEISKIFVKAK